MKRPRTISEIRDAILDSVTVKVHDDGTVTLSADITATDVKKKVAFACDECGSTEWCEHDPPGDEI